ncbi:hypothetical protein PILCRDRAFT_45133, partial [Piloderma croceum F 1598]
QIILNPGAFINVILCSCNDTFQSVYPQCVDCFEQTNQTDLLATTDAPAIVDSICALAGSLVGGATATDGDMVPRCRVAHP